MSVLVLSDHDDAAKRIARALSGGTDTISRPPEQPVHSFKRDGKDYHVVGLDGPLTEVDYPAELRNWKRTEIRELVQADLRTRPRPQAAPTVETLRALAADADHVVAATRDDLEGDLVAADAADVVRAVRDDLPVARIRFSALTKDALEAAFDDGAPMDADRVAAARVQRETQLAWTAVLTRFVALTGNARRGAYLRLGRLECAALGLIAAREREIRSFVPQAYWKVVASVAGTTPFDAVHAGGRFETVEDAEQARADAADATRAEVVVADTTPFSESPPSPLDADTLQRHASRDLGMTPAQAMQVADRLFLGGYITDPRTAGTDAPAAADVDPVLHVIGKMPEYRDLVAERDGGRPDGPPRGDPAARPRIHPVQPARQTDLSKDEWDLYDLVVRHFLAGLAPDAEGQHQAVHLRIGSETFEASGARLTRPRWRKHYPFPPRTDGALPEVAPGDPLPVDDIRVTAHETRPPARYDSTSLLRTMQQRGLGTAATRPTILRRLSERKYTRNQPMFEPTDMTMAVIDALASHAAILTDPARCARLDTAIQAVADGARTREDVLEASRRMLDETLTALEANQEDLAAELQAALRIQERVGRCPTCGKDLIVRRARKTGKRFIGCSGWPDCKESYPLPQAGYLEPLDTACDACGAPEMRLTKRSRRPWEFCANMDCPRRDEREANQRRDESDTTAHASAGE